MKADKSPEQDRLRGVRILLVEDSDDVRETLAELCELEGAQVTTACDSFAALAILAKADFDILISDIGMPDMDGCELVTALRRSARNVSIPAISLTGDLYSEKVHTAGFNDQLQKPISIEELVIKLCTYCRPG